MNTINPSDIIALQQFQQIDWSNPSAKISKHFTVREAIYLKQWGRLATEADGLTKAIKQSIFWIANTKMDALRDLVGKPIFIKSWYRPKKYNIEIGGARLSAHMYLESFEGAVDWWADIDGDGDKDGADCDLLKELLKPYLQPLNIRMENNGKGARWIHIDTKEVPPNGNRFFKP